MTESEAIETLIGIRLVSGYSKKREEALDMAIAALEKQEGKKPVYNGVNCECPFCNTTIEIDMKPWYCDICGQRIDWGDEL